MIKGYNVKKTLLKIVYFSLVIVLSTPLCAAEADKKEELVATLMPEMEEVIKLSIEPFKAMIKTMGLGSEKADMYEEIVFKYLSEELKENFSLSELQSIKSHISTEAYHKDKKMILKVSRVMLRVPADFLTEKHRNSQKPKISQAYEKRLRALLKQDKVGETFAGFFDSFIEQAPKTVAGMSKEEIEAEKKIVVEHGINLIMQVYADNLDEKDFHVCADFELSKVGRKLSNVLRHAIKKAEMELAIEAQKDS